MSRRNTIATVLAASAITAGAGVVFVRGGESAALPVYWDAPEFALVDQHGDTLRSAQLRGTIWIAGFVFTNCEDVCPLISARMARVRDALAGEGLLGSSVRLVSFSVDPGRDTPEALREYARIYGGSPAAEWAFLTGASAPEMERLVQGGFRLTMLHPRHAHGADQEDYQVMHSPRLLLVDPSGWVRGSYDATDGEAVERLWADLRVLLSRK